MAVINGTALDDLLNGTNAGDTIRGLAGNDDIVAGNGSDRVLGGLGNDVINGDAGNDLLEGGEGNDRMDGGTGNDRLLGGLGNDVLFGGEGNDILDGGTGIDTMRGGEGNDTYFVAQVGDRALELNGQGTDLVNASISFTLTNSSFVENLTLTGLGNINGTGNNLNNTITGNDGNNALSGGSGLDLLIGGDGDDILTGGSGADRLVGGLGDDTFNFDLATDGVDTIVDFDPLTDLIQISAVGFNAVEVQLGSQLGAFVVGAAAVSASDRFIYNAGTGALSFDEDGIGAIAAVQFAQLTPGLALTGDRIVAV